MKTAEWLCTSCGVTNRRLVNDNETRAEDRCMTCKKKHVVEEDDRPVRWRAKAKS
jgi:DNA-directed RNA polymerase subunit RPC12/RpoP